jgi:putative DNA primase/helicase
VPDAPADTAKAPGLNLDEVQRLDPMSFPNIPREGSSSPPATIPNIKYLLTSYDIHVKSNVITKRLQITMPGQSGMLDSGDSSAVTQIISLATFNAIATGQIWSYIEAIADNTPYNPVAEWIESKPWDGGDRLPAIYDTLTTTEEFPEWLKCTLVRKWLLSAVAAGLMPSGFSTRGVLTFQGGQGIGKTNWLKSLVPDAALRHKVVKVDHHLDPNNKDSILGAIVHWLVEIGELDSSFRKDVARLKGFITSDSDKVRRPYGRTESEYPRKTVFVGAD